MIDTLDWKSLSIILLLMNFFNMAFVWIYKRENRKLKSEMKKYQNNNTCREILINTQQPQEAPLPIIQSQQPEQPDNNYFQMNWNIK